MSTIVYAKFTKKRLEATRGKSLSEEPPGLGTYVDALVALVPGEALALHAIAISFLTTIPDQVTRDKAIFAVFFVLIGVSVLLYVLGRVKGWQAWDFARMCIPPLAFVGWTMIQKATAFDVVAPTMNPAIRFVAAAIGAVVLTGVASLLANNANQTARAADGSAPAHDSGEKTAASTHR